MYNFYINELKSKYTQQILSAAVRRWKEKDLSVDEMADKLDQLQDRLETSGKNEFIEIYKSYVEREGLIVEH